MFRKIVYGMLVALTLAACSTTGKQAPVEDLSAAAKQGTAPVTEATPGAQTSTAGMGTTPIVEAQPSGKTGGGGGEQKVQTSALPTTGTEVSQLGGGGNGGGTVGQSGGTGIGPMGYGPTGVPGMEALKDPNSPLAQRVIYFDYDSSTIPVKFQSMLEAHAAFIKAHKDIKVVLQGNTDERGSREYNLALGQRRADSVLQALNLLGVPQKQMEAISFGEEKPVAQGHNEAAWKLNRRTVIAYPNE